MTKTIVSIRRKGLRLRIRAPFNRKFIQNLKGTIPKDGLSWDSSTHEWTLHIKHRRLLQALLDRYFDEAVWEDPEVEKIEEEITKKNREQWFTILKEQEDKKREDERRRREEEFKQKLEQEKLKAEREWREKCQFNPDNPFDILHLKPTAPKEVIRAAYRALSNIYHPDKGGDGEIMKQITNAYSEILERLGM